MPSECGITSALLAGIGDARIRQRMEACQQGIVQLDSLRQKHTRLMEQLRSQYPDFTPSPSHSSSTEQPNPQYSKTLPPITESPPTPHRYESTTLPQPSSSSFPTNNSTSLPSAMNAAFATRCESPISACNASHRSSVSIDSGYTSISSDPFLSISSTPMSYSAFRKKAATLERPPHTSSSSTTLTEKTLPSVESHHQKDSKTEQEEIESTSEKMIETTIESTTGTAPMRQTRFGRKRDDSSWHRPRSMYAMISTNNNNNENEDKSGDIKDKERESFANVSVASTARKLLDTSTFSQITPPPMSRKFATLQKTPPKPLPRSIYPPSQCLPSPSIRTLSTSALHEPIPSSPSIPSTPTTRTCFIKPPPQFAKLDSAVQLQNAKVFAPIQSSPKVAPSANSAFTPKNSLKPGSTPPTKPRGTPSLTQQQSRAFIVPILASSKETFPPPPPTPRHHQASLNNNNNNNNLSRQQSYETNSLAANSPLEIRKMFISTPYTISRYGNTTAQNVNRYTFEKTHHQSSTQINSSRNRREKIWHESEGL